jgi:hypothetical protein
MCEMLSRFSMSYTELKTAVTYELLIGEQAVLVRSKHVDILLSNLLLDFKVRSISRSHEQATIHNVFHV